MTNTIFDLVKDVPEGKEGFFQIANEIPDDKDYLSKATDFGKTILKGTIEGVTKLGRMMGPLGDKRPESEIQEQTTQRLDELLPTDEGFLQRGLRRGVGEAPTMLAFPGSKLGTLTRSIAAGFLGESAKELGLPEWAQTAAEITAYIGPDLTKKLLETGKNEEIIKTAKKFGLTDEQIAPLLQSDFKQRWLSKLTPKRGKTQKILEKTKEGLGGAYETLKGSKAALTELSSDNQAKLLKSLGEIGLDIPFSVREKVTKDFLDLLKKPITGETLFNLHKDINKSLGPHTKELSRFKEPIKEALGSISPELADDFQKINNLYARYSKIAGRLKPTIVSDLIRAAEVLGITGSIILGDASTFAKFMFEKGSRSMSRELLLNPRLQQLSEKTLMALNQNKYGLAAKLTKQIQEEIVKNNPSLEKEMTKISEEEYKNIFLKD